MKKNYTISIPVKTFWTLILPIVSFLVIAGGITGVFLVDRVIIPKLPGISNRGILSVPDIANMSKEKARQALYDIGLRLQVQEREYSNEHERDVVLRQDPKASEQVKKGRHVFVVLSKGAEVSKVPITKGISERHGKKLLREAGFANVIVYKVYSEKLDKDLIIGTNPIAGTTTSREIPVKITISKGPKPTHAIVPNVIGEMLSDAKKQIKENGLSVGIINYRSHPKLRAGTVITQSAAPGTKAPLESKMNLVVSSTQ